MKPTLLNVKTLLTVALLALTMGSIPAACASVESGGLATRMAKLKFVEPDSLQITTIQAPQTTGIKTGSVLLSANAVGGASQTVLIGAIAHDTGEELRLGVTSNSLIMLRGRNTRHQILANVYPLGDEGDYITKSPRGPGFENHWWGALGKSGLVVKFFDAADELGNGQRGVTPDIYPVTIVTAVYEN